MIDETQRAAFEAQYPNHANAAMRDYHNYTWATWQLAWQAATAQATAAERERIAQYCRDHQVSHTTRGGATLVLFNDSFGGKHEGMVYAEAIRKGEATAGGTTPVEVAR